MSALLQRCGVKARRVPLTHGQNVAKQLGWLTLKCLLGLGFVFFVLWMWPVSQRLLR